MRYYGCKSKLLDFISESVHKTGINHGAIFCDLFTGTTSVAKYFKEKGYTVYANDFLEFSYILAHTYIKINRYPKFKGLSTIVSGVNGSADNINKIIDYLNNIKPIKGFIFNNYCPGGTRNLENPRKYFTDENGMMIDAIRTKIQEWNEYNFINKDEYYILLASLIEAVPFVANISGNYAAFLKHWDPRASKKITLSVPKIMDNTRKNKAFKAKAESLITKIKTDILYLDPPYNGRQYASNYFMLEMIAEGWFGEKKPEIYGVTGMRPYDNQKSYFCQKNNVLEVFKKVIKNAQARFILLSYNDEGLLSEKEILETLSQRGKTKVFKRLYRRYKSINQDDTDRNNVYEKLYLVKVSKG